MHAIKRSIKTCRGYDELWSDDGKLSISYYGERSYDVVFDGNRWYAESCEDEQLNLYLCSAATFEQAISKCRRFDFPLGKIYEFIPQTQNELIPSELLRLLMDDCGLGIYDACKILARCFGAGLSTQPERSWLYDIQPRTAHLESVLRDSLCRFGFAVHNAYDENYRFPAGAVQDGSTIRLTVHTFGGVTEASACIYGDAFETEIAMQRSGNDYFCDFTPTSPAALWYSFKLKTADGDKLLCADEGEGVITDSAGKGFRLTVYKRGFETPEWFRHSIMYQIFPDRFGFTDDDTATIGIEYHKSLGQTPQLHKSLDEPVRYLPREFEKDYAPDDFYGGNLRGITKKLTYLKGIGISVIYLNPIFEARSNHRYDTSDYGKIDPILGSEQDYVNLCVEAEKLGIAIINDGVYSHTGADSIYFNRYSSYASIGACQGEQSEFYKWYDFKHFPDKYRCWWDFKDLPEINELDTSWQDYIVSSDDSIVRKWLRLGASGWRIDVADELPDEVLSLIRTAAKTEKPDSVIIGEVWEDAVTKVSYGKRRNYALGYSLDSVMNYPFRSAVIDFVLGRSTAFDLRDFLLSQQANYPQPLYRALMNLLGSHDVERLHTALAFNFDVKALDRKAQAALKLTPEQHERATGLQQLCAAIQYCVPGVPCLYYGDEECLDGARDPFNRGAFEPVNSGLHNYYAKLADIRNTNRSFTEGTMELLTPAPDVLIILREYNLEKTACVINRSENDFEISFKFSKALLNGSGGRVPSMSAEIYKLT